MSAGYSEKVYVTRAIEEVRWSLLVVTFFHDTLIFYKLLYNRLNGSERRPAYSFRVLDSNRSVYSIITNSTCKLLAHCIFSFGICCLLNRMGSSIYYWLSTCMLKTISRRAPLLEASSLIKKAHYSRDFPFDKISAVFLNTVVIKEGDGHHLNWSFKPLFGAMKKFWHRFRSSVSMFNHTLLCLRCHGDDHALFRWYR